MQMPSSYDSTQDFNSNTFANGKYCPTDKTDNASLHNRVAKFVLDIQSDVALEDLLGGGNTNRSYLKPRPYGTIDLNDEQRRALKQLYNEIKNQQHGAMNSHDRSAKRTSIENGYGKAKAPRNTVDCLLQGMDNVDEAWLMNLAEQLGLDKDIDLPELNSDLVTELT